jgi:site-specific recombinase XerD
VQEGTIRALKSFAVLMPEARQATLYADLTQTTPTDIDSWIEASFCHHLAPSTVATRLRVVQGFFSFLQGTHLRRDTVIPQWFQASKAAAASDGHAVHCWVTAVICQLIII